MVHARLAWRPFNRQVELLVDCLTARLGTAETARQLGVSEPEFVAWAKRVGVRSESYEVSWLDGEGEEPPLPTAPVY
jgi:hypothetical protein